MDARTGDLSVMLSEQQAEIQALRAEIASLRESVGWLKRNLSIVSVPLMTTGSALESGSPAVGFRPGTNVTVLTGLWTGAFMATGDQVDYKILQMSNAISMTWQGRIRQADAGAWATVIGPYTAVTGNVWLSDTFTIPLSCLAPGNTSIVGTCFEVELQAARVGGTSSNTVDLALWGPMVNHS